jgi:ribonuclease H / adenosylcobalamin/alpha-ribazole phosphatase
MLEIWIDGAITFNPGGEASFGLVAERDGVVVYSQSGYVGSGPMMSNNVAEYAGAIAALEWVSPDEECTIYSDSQIVVRRMRDSRTSKGLCFEYCKRAKGMLAQRPNVKFQWIPREENEKADGLSRLALENYSDIDAEFRRAMNRDA